MALVLTFASQHIFSQDKENQNPYAGRPFKERLFIGGDLGLNFGTITYIRIAPLLGYHVSHKFSVGAGPSYQFYNDKRFTGYKTSIYGGSVFARYFVLEQIFLQTDFEVLNLEELNYDPFSDHFRSRVTIPIWLVGAGFIQRTPSGSGFFIGAFYDLIGDLNSPYPSDIILRVGGVISF